MKRIHLFIILLVICLSILLLNMFNAKRAATHQPVPASPTTAIATDQPKLKEEPKSIDDLPERDRTAINLLKSIYAAPISVYGKVVDENNSPISGAIVEFSLNDKYFKEGTKGTTVSDMMGYFTVKGSGVSVYIKLQKEGYYLIPNRSNGSIRANQDTSLEKPVVFVLKKAGSPQSLVHNEVLSKAIPVNTPVDIDLTTRKPVNAGQGHIQVQVWIDGLPPLGQKYNNFAWHCRVSVPGGGIIERKNQLAFEAPSEGYQTSMEATFKQGEGWKDFIEKDIYVHLPNGTYARGKLYLAADTDEAHVSFDSYWNKSGSRNLEAGANWAGDAK